MAVIPKLDHANLQAICDTHPVSWLMDHGVKLHV